MDQYLTPGVVLGVLALAMIGVRFLVDVRTLRAVPAGKEAITRDQYERDEKARRERHRAVVRKCNLNARARAADRERHDKKFDLLVDTLNELKCELARLATCFEKDKPKEPL